MTVATTTSNGASRAFDACCLVYSEMLKRSTPREESGIYKRLIPDGVERVFIGSLIALFRDLGFVSLGTYHNHKHELVAMGCIRRLQKGMFGHTESVWALHHPPTYDLWVRFVGREFRPRDAEIWDQHEQGVENFLQTAPTLYPRLLRDASKAGARTRDNLLNHLAGLPETTLRSLHPLCLAFAVPGTVHTCGVAPLDPLAPTSAEGAWKRKRDHLRRLQESPSP